MTPQEAERIAFIAHTACGQYRANKITHFIEHPRRVAALTAQFSAEAQMPVTSVGWNDRLTAAWLHDILEDTKLTGKDLKCLGISDRQLEIVELLTKADPSGPTPPSYYQAISGDNDALIVKTADQCANIEDSLKEILEDEPKEPRRWGRFVEATKSEFLPLLVSVPILRREVKERVDAFEAALPGALERRQAVVQKQLGMKRLGDIMADGGNVAVAMVRGGKAIKDRIAVGGDL